MRVRRTFWTELEVLTPLLEIINAIVTFLEGDGALLSHAPLAFAVIAENLTLLNLPPAIVVTVKRALVKRYSTIASPLHALAVVWILRYQNIVWRHSFFCTRTALSLIPPALPWPNAANG